jgi:tuftelin-interacting protein 11
MSSSDWETETAAYDSSDDEYSDDEEAGDRRGKRKSRLSSRRNDTKRLRGGGAEISFVSSISSTSVVERAKELAALGGQSGNNMGKPDKEVGAWQKHTKGIGLKYLQKFGFKGRLGKDEDGISAPIEAVVHGASAGLGFGKKPRPTESLSNTAALKHSSGEDEYNGIGEDGNRDSAVSIAKSHRWKKRGDSSRGEEALVSIIDMRSVDGADLAGKTLGEELLHNLDLAYDTTLSERAIREGKMKEMRSKMSNLQLSIVDVTNHISAEMDKCSKLNNILSILHEVSDSRASNASAVTTFSANQIVCGLHKRFPDEFKVFGLISLVCLADAAIINLSLSWDPSLDQPAIKDIFKDMIDLAAHFREVNEASTAEMILGVIQEQCETYFLSAARDYFSTVMNMLSPETGITLLRTLMNILGEDSVPVIDLLDMCIMPRLHKAISTSGFSAKNSQPISSWILPWRSVLGDRMVELESSIRLQLVKTVDHWDTDFVEIRKHIAPWSNVLEVESFRSLVLRTIMPKFIYFMRTELMLIAEESSLTSFSSSSQSQTRDRLLAIFGMKKIIPKRHFDALIQGEFLPSLLNRLVDSVDSDPSHQMAIFRGLVSCRESFGEQDLNDDQKLRYFIATGFRMVDLAVTGNKVALMKIAVSLRGLDYFGLIEEADMSARLGAIVE